MSRRPQINVGGSYHEIVEESWRALVEGDDPDQPRVMVRGNALVRMTERGELEAWLPDSLREQLSLVADFGKNTADGWKGAKPPMDATRSLLARDSAEYADAPRVERVVDVPVLAEDGTLLVDEGYHAGSCLFLRPERGMEQARPISVASVDDVVWARDFLMQDLLGDFAWADDASKANTLALLLLPFVREFIGDGPTPLHVITAPEIGTGKTLLAQAALLPGCGVVPVMAGDRDNNDEWRKSLTASLMQGARAIVFDNLAGTLDSASLAAALTTGVWRDRVLQYSKEVCLPVRNAWVATGNNLGMSPELVRRSVPIFLDPGDKGRPSDRPKAGWRHADLLTWAHKNRVALASAALTLIQHWLDGEATMDGAGVLHRVEESDPVAPERMLGTFERWSSVVGGILAAADVPGFLENRDRLELEADDESYELALFLEAWHALGIEPVEVSKVAHLCFPSQPLYEALPSDLVGQRQDGLQRRLPYWLRERKDRRVGGYQLVMHEGRRRTWSVRQVPSSATMTPSSG